jgi:hypothetical protein
MDHIIHPCKVIVIQMKGLINITTIKENIIKEEKIMNNNKIMNQED